MKVSIAVPTRGELCGEVRERIEAAAGHFRDAGGRVEWNVVAGRPVDKARTLLVLNAIRQQADAVFFVDDDTLLDEDALTRLAAHADAFVTGVVFRRLPDEHNHACIAWQRERLAGLWQYADSWCWPDYFEVDVSGLATALVTMEVFRRIAETGSKWFKWNWFFEHPSMPGRKSLIPQGEDIYLCLAAKRAGFRIMCDSSVRCGHLDMETGAVYPSAAKWDEFRRGASRPRVVEMPELGKLVAASGG